MSVRRKPMACNHAMVVVLGETKFAWCRWCGSLARTDGEPVEVHIATHGAAEVPWKLSGRERDERSGG